MTKYLFVDKNIYSFNDEIFILPALRDVSTSQKLDLKFFVNVDGW